MTASQGKSRQLKCCMREEQTDLRWSQEIAMSCSTHLYFLLFYLFIFFFFLGGGSVYPTIYDGSRRTHTISFAQNDLRTEKI